MKILAWMVDRLGPLGTAIVVGVLLGLIAGALTLLSAIWRSRQW